MMLGIVMRGADRVVPREDSATVGAALTNHFIKIGHLTVNRVPDFRGNCRALLSALHHVVPQITKASAATD
jgi:hypothetical protein